MMDEPVDQTPEDDPLDAILARRKQQSVDPLDAILAKRKQPEKPIGHIEGIARAINKTLPGYADLEGLVNAVRHPSTFGQSFTEGRKMAVDGGNQYAEDHPYIDAAAQVAGNVPAMLLAGKLPVTSSAAEAATGLKGAIKNVGRAVGQGAGVGAVYGAANANDPTLGGRALGGSVGAVEGGALAGLLHPIAHLSARKDAPPGTVGQEGRANQAAIEALASEGTDVPTFAQTVGSRKANVRGELGADYSPALLQATKEAAGVKDPRSASLREYIDTRDIQAPDRIAKDVSQVSANPKSGKPLPPASSTVERIAKSRDVQAERNFGAANQSPATFESEPEYQTLQSTPIGAALIRSATESAANKPRKLPQVPTGNYVDAKSGIQVNLKNLPAGVTPQQFLRAQLASGAVVPETAPTLDTEALHYLLQEGRRAEQNGYLNDRSKTFLKTDADQLGANLDAIQAMVDRKNPAFPTAMQTHATLSGKIDALNTGRNFRQFGTAQGPEGSTPDLALGKGDPQATGTARTGIQGLEAALKNATPENRTHLRAGMTETLQNELAAVPRRSGAGKAALKSFPDSPEGARSQGLLGTPKQTRTLADALSRETNMAETASQMPGYGTRDGSEGLDRAMEEASRTHSMSPTYIAARGLFGAAKGHLQGRPNAGALADALRTPAPDLASALAAYQQHRKGVQDRTDILRTSLLLPLLSGVSRIGQ